jgi:putative tryptophan/tyrosine transport system substrate-binding protein
MDKEVKGNMKKIMFFVLSAAVVLVLGAGPEGAVAAAKKIALMWQGKAGMPKRVSMGFLPAIKKLAPGLEVTTKIDIPSMQEAETVFHSFETTMNGIVFLRSNGAEFLAKANAKIPCFIGACNNPQELGVVRNLNQPEGNITGVTYFIPYEKRFQVLRSIFPNVKSICLLLQEGHPASHVDRDGTKAQCEKFRIAYNEIVASNATELLDKTKKIIGNVDMVIISSTAVAIDNAVSIVGICNVHKITSFSYAEGRAKLGVTAEVSADDEKLGAMLAESVADVVVKGKPVAAVPVKMDPNPQVLINEKSLQTVGIQLPKELPFKVEILK